MVAAPTRMRTPETRRDAQHVDDRGGQVAVERRHDPLERAPGATPPERARSVRAAGYALTPIAAMTTVSATTSADPAEHPARQIAARLARPPARSSRPSRARCTRGTPSGIANEHVAPPLARRERERRRERVRVEQERDAEEDDQPLRRRGRAAAIDEQPAVHAASGGSAARSRSPAITNAAATTSHGDSRRLSDCDRDARGSAAMKSAESAITIT